MSDGTAERGTKRRRIDDGAAAGEYTAAPGGATVGAIGWVVVHDPADPVVFSPTLQLADADKILISRALAHVMHYPYDLRLQYLTRPVPGATRAISDKVKYNIQACPPLPPSERRIGGPCMQVEVQFPIGVVLSMSLFNDIAALDPARIPMSEMKFTTRPERGADGTMETIFISLFRVYALPQTEERITYIYHSLVSSNTHPPGAVPVSMESPQASNGGGVGSWLLPFLSRTS